jgi:hypothetical protein
VAYPVSPEPTSAVARIAEPPPSTPATAPDVVDTALADTSEASSVVCGRPAESADSTNRFTENTARPAT